MKYSSAWCLTMALLAGCAGNTSPDNQFASATVVFDTVAAGILTEYVACHNRAGGDEAKENLCFARKDQRADELDQAVPLLVTFGNAVIALNQIPDGSDLQRALVVLSSLKASLGDALTADQQAAMAYLDGGAP